MIKKAWEEISKSKPNLPDSNKNNLSVMIPKNPWNLKLDIITENAKGNDSSSNSSRPTEIIDDRSWNLDESNLEDEIKGIPQEVDNLQDISAFGAGDYEIYNPDLNTSNFGDLIMEQYSLMDAGVEEEKAKSPPPARFWYGPDG